MRARTRIGALAIASAGVLVVGACGADGEVTVVDDTPMQIAGLQTAAASTAELTSAELTLQMTTNGETVMSSSIITKNDAFWATAEFDYDAAMGSLDDEEVDGESADDDLLLDYGDFPDSGEVIVIGDQVFVKGFFASMFFLFSSEEVETDSWIEVVSTGDGATDSEFDSFSTSDDMTTMAQDAFDVLGLLDGAYGEVTEIGREDVGGVGTTHYQVDVDAESVADALGEQIGEDLGDDTEIANADTTVDVWMDDDGLVRRISTEYDDFGDTYGYLMEITPADDITIEAPTDATPLDPDAMFDGLTEGFEDIWGDLDADGVFEDLEGEFDDLASEFGEALPTEAEMDEWLADLESSLDASTVDAFDELVAELEGLADEASEIFGTEADAGQ